MEKKKVLYSSIELIDSSKIKIINEIVIPEGWKRIKDLHCTICLGELPPEWKSRIGDIVRLYASEYGFDPENKVLAIKIDNFKRLIPGASHITVAINEENSGKPKDSNNIIDWQPLPNKILILTGIIQEITN